MLLTGIWKWEKQNIKFLQIPAVSLDYQHKFNLRQFLGFYYIDRNARPLQKPTMDCLFIAAKSLYLHCVESFFSIIAADSV